MRRAQLVAPFGVGAMSVLVDGTSVITAGLDHWYDVPAQSSLLLDEYVEHDWRLQARLRVKEFRLPPDSRSGGSGGDNRNVNLTVPVLRFPRWSFCMYCKRLKLSTLTMREPERCVDPKHADSKTKPRMSQVPFVAICVRGHLEDFPFDKWVHRSHQPKCGGVLRLESRGGGGLEGQVVVCDSTTGCGMSRPLRGITSANMDGDDEHTYLSDNLVSKDDPYLCEGARPWLAESTGLCGEPIRGALRAAGNVYFPKVESSIYLPKRIGAVTSEMHDLMRRGDVSPVLGLMPLIYPDGPQANELRQHLPVELFAPISDADLLAAYIDLTGIPSDQKTSNEANTAGGELLTSDDEWRFPEWQLLRETPQDDYLTASDPGLAKGLESDFSRVRSVEVLRETRALRGFTRVRDETLKLSVGKALLRRKVLPPEHDWLPAYVVKGEGIYLELDGERLSEWESRGDVQQRAQTLTDHFGQVASHRGLGSRVLSPRFVMIHTFAHLLINELVFACGYSSASLRERLYVSDTEGKEMAGVLIYTAAGDSEGTMGGLVRMARPLELERTVNQAVDDARWCSTDPVCMDAGEKGQGPDSCNLAACHGCTLLPETSCEEYNRFLDRGLVIGTFSNPALGFFSTT
ncbi:DUF1998 domain-containing protein [Herbiconiux sp. VKM Ac-1786]|nr:DUF1998 domain-containing protein [Herbiconiux sp. VKM Ac-1786]MBF4573176.1 DUF1998 domain-containing protein [Herbiconiux sp. VKM Ac-1786]